MECNKFMFSKIKELYQLLTPYQRSKLIRLQVLVVVMAITQLAGVFSIGPFMALVGDAGRLNESGLLSTLQQISGIQEPQNFIFWFGVCVLLILAISTVVSIFTVWRLSMYGASVGAELSCRLYSHYMHQPWLFHASASSSQLVNQIAQECGRVTAFIIQPLMQINAQVVMAFLMLVALFAFDPKVAAIGGFIFAITYLVLYRTVRRRLIDAGSAVTETQRMRFKLMAEGFGGIKDVLVLGRQKIFTERFHKASMEFARAHGLIQIMSQVPRYAMELIAFGSVIFLILYLLSIHHGDLGTILPLLSIYALAGFKLLPACQQIYSGISSIRGNLGAFDSIRADLHASIGQAPLSEEWDENRIVEIEADPSGWLRLSNVSFTYPGKFEPALNSVSIDLPLNKTIGFVGASGAGKSTLIDLLLGLIEAQKGEFIVAGKPVDAMRRRAWQDKLGFVPQSIFLTDNTIRENIAFGIPPEDIREEDVLRAMRSAHLETFVGELPHGLDTQVGERGVQLSGGQRQRIGIARALYNDADVLIFDEATSALDGETERLVMEALNEFNGTKTVILIAHRLATVRGCDVIFLVEDGVVTDSGTYDELAASNEMFKRMAKNA